MLACSVRVWPLATSKLPPPALSVMSRLNAKVAVDNSVPLSKVKAPASPRLPAVATNNLPPACTVLPPPKLLPA